MITHIRKNNYLFLAAIFSFILIGGILFLPFYSHADEWVNGYFRSNGTWVNGYWRSSPDGNPYNNYSFPGNYNPHTGKIAPGDPNTYLRNYYNHSSYGAYDYFPSYNSGDIYDYSYPSYDSYNNSGYSSSDYSIPYYNSNNSYNSYDYSIPSYNYDSTGLDDSSNWDSGN